VEDTHLHFRFLGIQRPASEGERAGILRSQTCVSATNPPKPAGFCVSGHCHDPLGSGPVLRSVPKQNSSGFDLVIRITGPQETRTNSRRGHAPGNLLRSLPAELTADCSPQVVVGGSSTLRRRERHQIRNLEGVRGDRWPIARSNCECVSRRLGVRPADAGARSRRSWDRWPPRAATTVSARCSVALGECSASAT
jgi:hypothetical protein